MGGAATVGGGRGAAVAAWGRGVWARDVNVGEGGMTSIDISSVEDGAVIAVARCNGRIISMVVVGIATGDDGRGVVQIGVVGLRRLFLYA